METLDVYLNDIKAGRLYDDNGEMSFVYDEQYIAVSNREPLSHCLPFKADPYRHGEIEAFLSNLLPDDIVRTRIAEILKIPRENTFALLKAIGGDCAGAIAFFPEGSSAIASSQPEYRELGDDEVGRILGNLERRPLDVGEEGFRISGAGAQDKLIACLKEGRVLLPLHGTPSTHIIKTALRDYPDSVENEWFCMQLAARCGLNASACEIALLGGRRCYVCRRYDREDFGGVIRRLHQEDFCQMLRIDPKRKYEAQGGPGITTSFRLLRELSLPASDTIEFLDRIIFNFLVGNGDAHGKNFSVLYRDGVAELSPFYDVMSTAIYPEVGRRMAMKLGGEYNFKWITLGKFVRMAESVGIGRNVLDKELAKFVRRIKGQIGKLVDHAERIWPSPCYVQVAEGIARRISQLSIPTMN